MEYKYFLKDGCIFRVPSKFDGPLYDFLEILHWINENEFNFVNNAYCRECAEEIKLSKCFYQNFKEIFFTFYIPVLGKEKAESVYKNHFVPSSNWFEAVSYDQYAHVINVSKIADTLIYSGVADELKGNSKKTFAKKHLFYNLFKKADKSVFTKSDDNYVSKKV